MQENVLCENGEFTVTFDPIDGSSVIDCNFSVGSIFGIWAGKTVIGKTGRSMVGAALSIYGTRTTCGVFNPQSNHVEEMTLMKKHVAKTEEELRQVVGVLGANDAKLKADVAQSTKSVCDFLQATNEGIMELFTEADAAVNTLKGFVE